MRILIVEDDALIAMDLEDIVQARTGAECLLAATVEQALAHVSQGVDFALLDVNLRPAGATSQPIAERLQAMGGAVCLRDGQSRSDTGQHAVGAACPEAFPS